MVVLMICALVLAALCLASMIVCQDDERELQPEPIRVRHNRVRRR
jgi:hypothetical protein